MSDGASAAVDTYKVTDWAGLLEVLSGEGPSSLLASIREIESHDVSMTEYARIKGSDDATVAYLEGVTP